MDNRNETRTLSFTASNVLSIVAIVLSVISILFSSLTMFRGPHRDFRPNSKPMATYQRDFKQNNQPKATYQRDINPNDPSYFRPDSQGYKPQFDRPFQESKGPGRDFRDFKDFNNNEQKETQ